MKKGKRFVSLTTKIIALFCVVIFAACIVISVITYRMESKKELEEIVFRSMIHLRSMAQDISNHAAGVEIIVQELAFDQAIVSLFRSKTVGNYIVQLLFSVQKKIEIGELHLSDLEANLLLLIPSEEFPESYDVAIKASRLKQDESYQSFINSQRITEWGPVEQFSSLFYDKGKSVAYYQKIQAGLSEYIGTIRCTVSADKLFQSLSSWDEAGGISVIYQNKAIYGVGENIPCIDCLRGEDQRIEGHWLYLHMPISSMGYSLMLAYDLSDVFQHSMENAFFMVVSVFLTGLCLLGLTIVLVRRMLSRLNSMTEAVSRISIDGHLTTSLPEAGVDEAGQLAEAFSSLLYRVDNYYIKLLNEEKDKRSAQRLALQYQMNPHFLFNSLYWIQLQMENLDMDYKVSNAISQLGTVLRYNLEGNFTALISEEEKHIRAYVDFMAAMKGGDIILDVRSTPSISHYRILRFSLQPLLENAIYHGYSIGETLCLEVCFDENEENDSFRISIANNGKPIEPERVVKLQAQLMNGSDHIETEKGVGLINLRRRMALTYGSKAEMKIKSEKGWTIVDITLPLEQIRGVST